MQIVMFSVFGFILCLISLALFVLWRKAQLARGGWGSSDLNALLNGNPDRLPRELERRILDGEVLDFRISVIGAKRIGKRS
jgi:hypothetical protein